MLDLHEAVAELFAEAQASVDVEEDASLLRLDNFTASNLRYEASWQLEARFAEGVQRWRCPNCGGEIELRPGTTYAIHLGPPAEIPIGCSRVEAVR